MKIETAQGIIINSDKIRYYNWADENGGSGNIGGKGDWYLTAYFSDNNSISLCAFERPNHSIPSRDNKHTVGWINFRDALLYGLPFYSFVGKGV